MGSMISDVVTYLNEHGYASRSGLTHYFAAQYADFDKRVFHGELKEACSQCDPQLGVVPREVACRSVLESNVYYSVDWIARHVHFKGESIGDIIGYDLYQRIVKNGWDQCRRFNVLSLDYDAFSSAHLEYVMAYQWETPRHYEWRRFKERYCNWNLRLEARALFLKAEKAEEVGDFADARQFYECAADRERTVGIANGSAQRRLGELNYISGLEAERNGSIVDAKRFYECAVQNNALAQYRLAKLMLTEIREKYDLCLFNVFYSNAYVFSPTETRRILDLLNFARKIYMPAAYLLGEMYNELGKADQARSFYEQAFRLAESHDWSRDDEAVFCLAKSYYYGNGRTIDSVKAIELCKRAAELGNPDAKKKLLEWNATN